MSENRSADALAGADRPADAIAGENRPADVFKGADMSADIITGDGRVPEVRTSGSIRALHFWGDQIQSRMSLLNPHALDLQYTRMMMGFLLFNPAPSRITMIGLGGGSLPKFCHRNVVNASIDVVEIDAAVIALRDAFMVPPDGARFSVTQGDGACYVADLSDATDVLLVDGYGLHGIAEELCTKMFFSDCHAALRESGMLVLNFHVEHPDYDVYLDRIRASFGASMFEVVDDDMTNSIVFACKGDLFDDLQDIVVKRPQSMTRDAWRQLMPTFKVIAATLVPR